VGGIPPAEPSQFRSDIFKQTPPELFLSLFATMSNGDFQSFLGVFPTR